MPINHGKKKGAVTWKISEQTSVTELSDDYGVGIEWQRPWNDISELTFSELLPTKTM
jgi:hypothetical protein